MRAAYRRTAVAGVAVLLVGMAANSAWGSNDNEEDRYRLATATLGDVEQTLLLSGAVEHTARSDAGFTTSGTVAHVYVAAGDRVRAGQPLARLDTGDLEATVTSAEAELAAARAQLESDQNAQEDLVDDASPQQEPPTQPQQPQQPDKPNEPDPSLQQALEQLAAQQQAVREASTASTAAIAAAKDALAAQQEACAVTEEQPTPTEDCATALAAVQTAQDTVASAQDALQQAIAALTETLDKAIAAVAGQSGTKPTAATDATTVVVPAVAMETPSSEDEASSSAGSIAADQAAIDAAKTQLMSARKVLRAATLRSPRDGVVASVDVARGDPAPAGTSALTVIGKGHTTVQVGATADQVRRLRVGQTATVTVPGRKTPFAAKVTSIGLLPTSGQDSTTYPVTVTLVGGAGLPTGSTATAAVVVDTAKRVVTVPASAVTDGRVRVLTGGRVVSRAVTVGAVGATTVEVEGIDAGTEVVLADRDADLPSSEQNQLGGFGDNGRLVEFNAPPGGGPPVVRMGK